MGIVHNNEQERLEYLLSEISKIVSSDYQIKIIKYGLQIEKSVSVFSMLHKTFAVLLYTFKWAKYTRQKVVPKVLSEFRTQMSFLLNGKAKRKKLSFINIICDAVSRKHLALLEIFLNEQSEYLLILESDAIFKNSNDVSNSLRKLQLGKSSNFPLFVSFVEPNRKSQGNLKGVHSSTNDIILQEKPWSNTACAYLINRNLAQLFVKQHSKRINSSNFALPIDWLLNSTFLKLSRAELENGKFIEFNSNPIIHGSIHYSNSWTRDLI